MPFLTVIDTSGNTLYYCNKTRRITMFECGDLVWYFGEKKTVSTVGVFGVYFGDGVFATHCMVKPIYRNGIKVRV